MSPSISSRPNGGLGYQGGRTPALVSGSIPRCRRAHRVATPATNADALDRLDGLVLVGGADVDARRYGAAPHKTADAPRESRDESETVLYLGARERGMPVLGICRGLQIMAVAHGGTLIQNLPDLGLATVHREVPGQFVEHEATFAPDRSSHR